MKISDQYRRFYPTINIKQVGVSAIAAIVSFVLFQKKISRCFDILNNNTPKFNKTCFRVWGTVFSVSTFIITTVAQKILGWGSSNTSEQTPAQAQEKSETVEAIALLDQLSSESYQLNLHIPNIEGRITLNFNANADIVKKILQQYELHKGAFIIDNEILSL